ncbi:MAG TPA: GNAT family N-acetyltransferase [Bryobacteraceae bacterium]|nr:GNAT family N-acetyltransferase [Bryobacteraceae bacterium]
MVHDSTALELSSDRHLAEFLKGFETCSIPASEWTHAAHLAMAAAYLLKLPMDEALAAARTGIHRFNESHGNKTRPERGYHESLTRLWIHVCDAFLQESGLKGAEAARALVALYGRRSDLYKEYYSYDVVRAEARFHWQPPDLKALPAAWRRTDLLISTNPRLLDGATIHGFLKATYWAPGIPQEIVDRCIKGSLPFGIYDSGKQVGFGRVITDRATFGYLADVFVLESHRGRGLSKWLIECVMSHPSLQGFRRWQLSTRDAHTLYRRFGFEVAAHPERLMEIVHPNIYLCAKS